MDGPGGVKLDGLKEGNWTVKMDKSRWPKKLEVNGPKYRSKRSKRLKVDGPKNGRSKEKQLED